MKKLIPLVIFLASASAFALGKEGHGGDSYSQEFSFYGKSAVRLLTEMKSDPANANALAGIDIAALSALVDKIPVNSMPDTTAFTGNCSDKEACNYPDDKDIDNSSIELIRSRWDALDGNQEKKLFLAMHEYFGILNVERDDYHVSDLVRAYYRSNASIKFRVDTGAHLQKVLSLLKQELSFNITDDFSVFDQETKSSEYSACVSPWFWSDKPTQIRACDKVEKVINNTYYYQSHSDAPIVKASYKAEDAALQAMLVNAPSDADKTALVAVMTSINTEFNSLNESIMKQFKQHYQHSEDEPTKCENMQLGPAIVCEYNDTKDFLKGPYSSTIDAAETSLENDGKNAIDHFTLAN